MEKRFGVTGEERKRLVSVIAKFTGEKSRYLGMPTAAYEIGSYMVTKEGTLVSQENADGVEELLRILEQEGFVDADAEIIALAGKSIPEIFAESGESGFRVLETNVLDTLGKQSGLVIATGGGCVTQVCNYPLLHQNGRIFWLKRPLDLLPTEGRPLSQSKSLVDMYTVRKPLYNAFSDHAVDNSGTPNDTIARILSLLEEME